MFAKDPSFRIGCGRYVQKIGAVKSCGVEILRLGRVPLIVAGKTAWQIAGASVSEGLAAENIDFSLEIYGGSCNAEAAEALAKKARAEGRDVIVGVGGGVIMDFAKLIARMAECPVANIPTSLATCAAYTPLSVCYTEDGRTVGTAHHQREVDLVIADSEILLREPPRLFLAGVFDAMAKLLEIRHWYHGEDIPYPLGLDYAYTLAERSYEVLAKSTAACLRALETGEASECFERAVFTLICVTGVISGISRGSQQTALGHKFYETARALYPMQTRPYLHGELVGIGLLWQNAYNGAPERNEELLSFMRAYGLPHSPAAAGVPISDESLETFFEAIYSNPKMKNEDGARLRATLEELWRK